MNAAELVKAYLELGETIKALESQQQQTRDQLRAELAFDSPDHPDRWKLPTGTVSWVKGRRMERLDKVALVKAGVTKEQIEKGTIVTEGQPTMRITPPETEE